MSYSYSKKTVKTYHKSKFQDNDRWDHSGFDQLQQEQYEKDNKSSRPITKIKKPRKNHPDNTLMADNLDMLKGDKKNNRESMKWQHDKYEESVSQHSYSSTSQENSYRRKDKKPDKPLYSVREKQTKQDDVVKTPGSSFQSSAIKYDKNDENFETPKMKSNTESFVSLAGEKETVVMEDDKSSISNVSTAISDRNKPWDDDNLNSSSKNENRSDTKDKQLTHNTVEDSSGRPSLVPSAGIELVIAGPSTSETIRIFDNEDDYTTLLEKICSDHHIQGQFALQFKIFILKHMRDSNLFDFRRIDGLYNKLLDINFKVLMYETNKDNLDDSILPYINNNTVKSPLDPTSALEENKA
jgi:hypothetical protein